MSEPGRGNVGAAIGGGVVGALVASAILAVAAPRLMGEQMVRRAMVEHPEILVEASDALHDRQYQPILASIRTSLETPFGSSWQGAAKPDVTLVEFYDYACGYCRKSKPDIDRLLAEDKGLRVVYREFPILGPESVAAARASLAASKAGQFNRFHEALFEAGRPAPDTIATAARAAGIAATSPETAEAEAELRRNFQIAGQLGATGTPLFIVGDRVMNAAVGYDALKKAIADARKLKG